MPFLLLLLLSTSLWATDHYQPLRMFAGHLADITCTRFHPNSNYVATGSADRTIRLWDILTGNCVRILTGHKVRGRLSWNVARPSLIGWEGLCSSSSLFKGFRPLFYYCVFVI